MSVTDQAFVTLATNDIYCQGALVVGQSLRKHRATRRLVVLVTPQVSHLLRTVLSRVFDEVIDVTPIHSADYMHLAFMRRPELGISLTKLHCWTLTQYSKCVFLDADTLVLSNIDELFDRTELSAAPDPGWPDCFNSGVFVYQPSLETHSRLLQHATNHGSFDGADQGLLNSFFSSWPTADIQKHLPFIYNLSSNTAYTYSPAFKQFGSGTKVVHFLGSAKPWSYTYNRQTGSVMDKGSGTDFPHQLAFLNLWWSVYHSHVLPLLENLQEVDRDPSPRHEVHAGGEGKDCVHAESDFHEPQPFGGPPERTREVDDTPSFPEESHREEEAIVRRDQSLEKDIMLGKFDGQRKRGRPPTTWIGTVAAAMDSGVTIQPLDRAEDSLSEDTLEPGQELSVEDTRTPALQDTVEVHLAFSVSEISIEEKVRELSPQEERRKWEEGHIDYLGRDSFTRIQEKLDRFLQ